MVRRGSARGSGVVVLALVFLATTAPGYAAFPGQNGKIAFSGWEGEYSGIFVVNPDGTGLTRLTTNLSRVESPDEDNPGWYIGRDIDPAWSPDGQRIAFSRETAGWAHDCRGGFESEPTFDLYVMNADGTDLTQLTSDPPSGVGLAFETDPTWSPDGEWLAYQASGYGVDDLECRYATDTRIVRTPADGPGTRQLIRWDGGHPSWRSDDERIAFAYGGIKDMPLDGSSERMLAPDPGIGYPNFFEPSYSGDGSKIVFRRDNGVDSNLIVMNADGSGQTVVTDGAGHVFSPVFAPDGQKLAAYAFPGIAIMNTDGSNRTVLSVPGGADPDWQPVQPGYPRPGGASPLRVPLVPAYNICTTPNRTHGPPLAFESCNPPLQRSAVLTVGTPDANGAPASMVGSVRYGVQTGDMSTPADEADVAIQVSVTDVRCAATSAACPDGALSDYEGKLLALTVSTRITDRSNVPPGPNGGPGTGNTHFPIPLDCTATASTSTGSSCSVSTTADALMPGAVTEGRRGIWALGRVQVRDAGPNGTGFEGPACPPDCGDGDETLFLNQGVFIP